MTLLKQELLRRAQEEKKKEFIQERRSQIGTGERSEKIRTYNFPQNRVTDHRIGKSWQNLEDILDGKLDKIISTLQKRMQKA
jgi:peptide chain release factor 1